MPYVESYDEFAARHGGRDAGVRCANEMIFPDGAVAVDSAGFGPILREPPTDRWENLAMRRRMKTLLDRAENEFRRHKQAAVHATGLATNYANVPIPSDAPERLRLLAAEVARLRKAFAELEAEWEESPRRQFERAYAREQAEKAALAARVQAEILSIVPSSSEE